MLDEFVSGKKYFITSINDYNHEKFKIKRFEI